MKEVFAIDPGNIDSAYAIVDMNYTPVQFGKTENERLIDIIKSNTANTFVIENIASFGMPVGREVFETCIFIGRLKEIIESRGGCAELMFRKDVKMNMCNSTKAKDGNIIQALKDRFGDKGTKANPGWFYGFKGDCWQAYALGVTYIDKLKEKNNAEI